MADPSAPQALAAAASYEPARHPLEPPPPSDPCPICLEGWRQGESWLQLPDPRCLHNYHKGCAEELCLKWDTDCGKCLVCLLPADALTPVSVLLREARFHRDRKEYLQCRQKLQEVMALDENHPDANRVLGEVHWNEGSIQKAKSAWQLAYQGGQQTVAFNLGVIHYQERDTEQAKRYLTEAHNQGYVPATFNLGVIAHHKGDMEQAKQYFIMAHNKGYVEASINVGVIHQREGDVELAKQCFMKAHHEGHVEATCNLGVLHQRKGDMEQATLYWMEAHSKGFVEATYFLGMNHHREGDAKQAKQYFMEAHHKGHVLATFQLGVMLEQEGDIEEAKQYFIMATREKRSAEASLNLGVISEEQGDMQLAKRHYVEAHNRGNDTATFQLGVIHYHEGDMEQAKRYFVEAHNRGSVTATFELGVIHYHEGDMEQAKRYLVEARNKRHHRAAVNLGVLHTEEGELSQAERCFTEAWARFDDAQAAVGLGFLCEKMGNMLEARKWYEEGVAKGWVSAFLDLGYLAMSNNEADVAEQHFTKVVQTGDATALLGLGLLRQRCGQATEAEMCYTAAIRQGCIPAKLCLATLYTTTSRQEEAAGQLPKTGSELLTAQRTLLRWMKWFREPAMCALTAGYVYLLQGNTQSAEAMYAKVCQDGLEVPPELLAAPPHFADISMQWAASRVDPCPAAAHECPQQTAGVSSTSSLPSPSAHNHTQFPPTADPEPQAPGPLEVEVSLDLLGALGMLVLQALGAEASGSKEELLHCLGSAGFLPPGHAIGQGWQEEGSPLPAAVPGADQPKQRGRDRGDSSSSSSPAHSGHGQQVSAQLQSVKVSFPVLARLLEAAEVVRDILAQPEQGGNEDSPRSKMGGRQPATSSSETATLVLSESPSSRTAPPGASNSSSSSSTTLPWPGPYVGLQRALAQLEELGVEHNKRLIEKPPFELLQEQADIYQQIQNQRDPVLVALESPEQLDMENDDVIRVVREQQLLQEKLYLLTFHPTKSQRHKFYDRIWSSPLLQKHLNALEEAGLPRSLPEPQLLADGGLAPGEAYWTGVKMLVPVSLYHKAKDLLLLCRPTLWPRCVVVSESTKLLVLRSLGTLGERHSCRVLCDEDAQARVHLLDATTMDTPEVPKLDFAPPLRWPRNMVANSTEAGSRYKNPRRAIGRWDIDAASCRAATDGQPADAAPGDS